MPELLRVENIERMRLIVTDGDSNEYQPINEAIVSSRVWRNVKSGLCTFHLFSQKWVTGVVNKQLDSANPSICQNIYKWITSWIEDIETNEEFKKSHSEFNKYLFSVKNEIGEVMHEATANLVENSMIPFLSKFVY